MLENYNPSEKHKELLNRTAEKRKNNKNKDFKSLSSLNINIPSEIYDDYKRHKDN